MLTKTRKNKGYTSVLMNEVSEQAFKEASTLADSMEGLKVIKPSKSA